LSLGERLNAGDAGTSTDIGKFGGAKQRSGDRRYPKRERVRIPKKNSRGDGPRTNRPCTRDRRGGGRSKKKTKGIIRRHGLFNSRGKGGKKGQPEGEG